VDTTHTPSAAQNGAVDFAPLAGGRHLLLTATSKAVTPFAGLTSFIAWLRQTGFLGQGARDLPFSYASPNAIPIARTSSFLLPVVVGASRFTLKLHGWSDTRRFVVVRELEREDKSAVGRRLIDVSQLGVEVFLDEALKVAPSPFAAEFAHVALLFVHAALGWFELGLARVGHAVTQELAIPWTVHGALAGVDFQLESLLHEARHVGLNSLSAAFDFT